MKRDLRTWKETYIRQKRPTYITRDPQTSTKETNKHKTRLNKKKDLHTSKETRKHQQKRLTNIKRDWTWKRPIDIRRDLCAWKETYIHQKRPTYMKKDLHTWKETYIHQKRPTYIKRDKWTGKETNEDQRGFHPKKETYKYQKRPMCIKRDILWTWRSKEAFIQK